MITYARHARPHRFLYPLHRLIVKVILLNLVLYHSVLKILGGSRNSPLIFLTWTVQGAELSSNCNWGITYGNKAYTQCKYGAHIRINNPTLLHFLLLDNWFSFLVLVRFTCNLRFPTGGMEAKGTRITLRITDPLDLNRDVLKVHVRLSQIFKSILIFEKIKSCQDSISASLSSPLHVPPWEDTSGTL